MFDLHLDILENTCTPKMKFIRKGIQNLEPEQETHAHRQTRQIVSTQFSISNFSVILNIFETEQLQIGNWVETRQNFLVLSPVLFTPPTRIRQDKTVLFCPCRRCEQVITLLRTERPATFCDTNFAAEIWRYY